MKLLRLYPMIALLLVLATAGPSRAGETPAVDADALENVVLMRVDGKVVIAPTGALEEIKIDTPLIPELQAALEKAARSWRFKPVLIDGVPRRASTGVRVVLAASQEGESFRVRIDSVNFPGEADAKATRMDGQFAPITAGTLKPPNYPPEQNRNGATGTILLGILVTPEGRVGEVTVIQSMLLNLNRNAGSHADRHNLHAFETAAIAAARRWTFQVPADGAARKNEWMTVTVPVSYFMDYDLDAAGQWLPVLRSAKRPMAWLPASPETAKLGVADITGSDPRPLASAFELSTEVVGTAL